MLIQKALTSQLLQLYCMRFLKLLYISMVRDISIETSRYHDGFFFFLKFTHDSIHNRLSWVYWSEGWKFDLLWSICSVISLFILYLKKLSCGKLRFLLVSENCNVILFLFNYLVCSWILPVAMLFPAWEIRVHLDH